MLNDKRLIWKLRRGRIDALRQLYDQYKGVKLGDTDKPIFWYRPEDSPTYRVIYADLSVLDVTAETLAAFEDGSGR